MKELTDLEINRKIADIEDIHYMETKYSDRDNFLGLVSAPDGSGTPPELIGEYNPLTDDALCFQLMVKYKVKLSHEYDETWICFKSGICRQLSKDVSPNKAICLAILEANK